MENNTKTLGKIVASWAQSDPLKRIILGLNIALEGAIDEESGEYPFEYTAELDGTVLTLGPQTSAVLR